MARLIAAAGLVYGLVAWWDYFTLPVGSVRRIIREHMLPIHTLVASLIVGGVIIYWTGALQVGVGILCVIALGSLAMAQACYVANRQLLATRPEPAVTPTMNLIMAIWVAAILVAMTWVLTPPAPKHTTKANTTRAILVSQR